MKYLLKIVLLTILFIPIALVDLLRAVWLFNATKLIDFWHSYKSVVRENYDYATGARRPRRF